MTFATHFSALKAGMRDELISGDQQFAYGLVCCYTWAVPFGTFSTVSLFTWGDSFDSVYARVLGVVGAMIKWR
tara:strand:- start:1483 stop:1701 length:219 start_codon:yes stop_codon:yes gene_type:complete